jgi:hypothetical protein
MAVERGGPAVCSVSDKTEGKDEMTKASISLQDLRRRLYVKAKADTLWRFWGLRSRNRKGFGWQHWSRQWLYETVGLFNGYRVRRATSKGAPA